MCIRDRYMGNPKSSNLNSGEVKGKEQNMLSQGFLNESLLQSSVKDHAKEEKGRKSSSYISNDSPDSNPSTRQSFQDLGETVANADASPIQDLEISEIMAEKTGLETSIAELLEFLASENRIPPQSERTIYHCKSTPSVSIQEYVSRIFRYSHCSLECYFIAMIYLDSLANLREDFLIDSSNVYR
eukprot:TRINITY_DN12577_c0_g1_i6.p1 TRINITY_DN12577_c0_g1~~TRINITY_DN12577_c0_g1_i6.p1  ORF type:complete len:205 (+),score=34.84 TRINITY_DN12577_c0_g1_i6:61-615(+)